MEKTSLMDMSLVAIPEMMELVSNTSTGTSSDKPNKNNNNNPQIQAPKRKKAMTSQYLKYFENSPDGKSRRCKFCRQSYSLVTATGNLARHLTNHHPGYKQHEEFSQEGQFAQTSISAPTKRANIQSSPKPTSQTQTRSKEPKIDSDQVNWFLLQFLINFSLPNSTLEDQSLQNSYKFLNPTVTIWSKEKAESITIQVFHTMREDVRAFLQNVTSKISLTLDFWTSYEDVLYMSVTSHWIDDTWLIHNLLLEICHVPFPRTGPEILNSLTRVISSFGLDSRVISCTCDNSPLASQACQLLKEEMDSRKNPFFYLPCGAHMLKMVIEVGLASVKGILCKVREFMFEMNMNLEVFEGFKQMLSIYREGPLKFPIDTSSSWNGDYAMLDLVYKASNSMDSTIKKYEDALGGGRNLILGPSEMSTITILHQFLDQFYKTTTNLCATKIRTVGLVLFFLDHIIELINSYRDNSRQDWLKTLADEMYKRTRDYNGLTCHVYNGFSFICAILDPRIKRELLPELLNLDKNLDEARGFFMREYCNANNNNNNNNNNLMLMSHINGFTGAHENISTSNSDDLDAVSFAEEIARKRRRASTSVTKDELTQYLTEPPVPISTDVLDWWKINSARFPRLSIMARDFLAVQGTSVEPEELFTSKCDELHKTRHCLPFSTMQRVLCVKSWVKNGFTFRFASSEIDFGKFVEAGSCSN